MDNVYCDGSEDDITSCRFDDWGMHDCGANEAAGVICYEEQFQKHEPEKIERREKVM